MLLMASFTKITQGQSHYYCLQTCFKFVSYFNFCLAPGYWNLIFNMCKPFLSEDTKKKIVIMGGECCSKEVILDKYLSETNSCVYCNL